MRIFRWKNLVGLALVGVCFGSAVRALADEIPRWNLNFRVADKPPRISECLTPRIMY
jgi:hypothetical protein